MCDNIHPILIRKRKLEVLSTIFSVPSSRITITAGASHPRETVWSQGDKTSPPPPPQPFLHFGLVLQTSGGEQSCSNNPLHFNPQNRAPNLRTDAKKLKSKPKGQLTRGMRIDLN